MTLRVLVVDDSPTFRRVTSAALALIPDIEVVGVAGNGKEALQVLECKGHGSVDVMLLDLEMPVLSGACTLMELQRLRSPVKIIVFSSASAVNIKAALNAMSLGASDFVVKPTEDQMTKSSQSPRDFIAELLKPKLLQFKKTIRSAVVAPQIKANFGNFHPQVVVVASSTGGPQALEKFFSNIRADFYTPVFVVQHMPANFTKGLAERLSATSRFRFVEADDNGLVGVGTVQIAPGDFHLSLKRLASKVITKLDQNPHRNYVRPCADFLFESAVDCFAGNVLGVVLTGMGADGKDGAVKIKKLGGKVLVQSEATCVVYGMPKAVVDAGAFDQQADLLTLSRTVESLACDGAAKQALSI